MKKIVKLCFVIIWFLLLWQSIIYIFAIPRFFLPTPLAVWQALNIHFESLVADGLLTLLEIFLGLLLGISLACLSAIVISIYQPLKTFILPILLVLQALPVFAIAPILVLWLGYGIAAKVAMATIIIYFPIVSSFYDGLHRVPKGFIDLAQSMGAGRLRILFAVRVKAALPMLGSGLKVAATLAPTAAVIGEWVGASAGLGYRMLYANARLQTAEMFAALLFIIAITLILYYAVDFLVKVVLPWQDDNLK